LQALWLEKQELRLRVDPPMPVPVSGEALVRVRLAGICATDHELTRGYYPFAGVPGHEFVGEIAETPSAPQRAGERVVGEINIGCGGCDACLAGRRNHCEAVYPLTRAIEAFERSALPGALKVLVDCR
jgi:threonine dehydrogenase-like Zn-dependent dehydrogenase